MLYALQSGAAHFYGLSGRQTQHNQFLGISYNTQHTVKFNQLIGNEFVIVFRVLLFIFKS